MRRAAWQAVRGFHDRGWRIAHSLDRIGQVTTLQPRDRAMASSLAGLCVRRRASLDAVLTAYVKRGRGEMENDLWLLAQLGAAQLFFRPDIPPRAAIHATCEVAREVNAQRWVGFLNGTLRTLSNSFEHADGCDDPSLAIADEARGWITFDRPILTDKQTTKRLSKCYSLPRWLINRWNERLPNAEAVMRASNRGEGLWLRTRPGERDAVLGEIDAAGHAAELGELPQSIFLPQSVPLSTIAAFGDGRASVQNITAMRAVDLLGPQPDERVLDLCAAPGGKTTAIAERGATVVAADSDEKRLPRVAENVARLGLQDSVELLAIGREGERMPSVDSFDAALVDVPCSNTGVLARRPEARWRVGPDDLTQLPPLQSRLLAQAAMCVKRGGRLVYSTCSIEPEENEQIVDRFLSGAPKWSRIKQHTTLPDARTDGGFRALLHHE